MIGSNSINLRVAILIAIIVILIIIIYKYNENNKYNNIENFSVLKKLKKKKSKNNFDNVLEKTKNNDKNITFDELMKQSEDFKKQKDKIPNFADSIINYKNSFKQKKFKNNSETTAEAFEKFALYKDKFFEIFK